MRHDKNGRPITHWQHKSLSDGAFYVAQAIAERGLKEYQKRFLRWLRGYNRIVTASVVTREFFHDDSFDRRSTSMATSKYMLEALACHGYLRRGRSTSKKRFPTRDGKTAPITITTYRLSLKGKRYLAKSNDTSGSTTTPS